MIILVVAILGPLLVAELLRATGVTNKPTPVIQLTIYGLIIAAFGSFVAVMWTKDQISVSEEAGRVQRLATERIEKIRQERLGQAAQQAVTAAEKVWGWDSGAPTEFEAIKVHFSSAAFFQDKWEGNHYVSKEEQIFAAIRAGRGDRVGLETKALVCLGTKDCIGQLADTDLPVFMAAANNLLVSIEKNHKGEAKAACTIKGFLIRNLAYVGAKSYVVADAVRQLESCAAHPGFNDLYLARAKKAAEVYGSNIKKSVS